MRRRGDEQMRFTVRHVRKQVLLRRIIGAYPQKELSSEETALVDQMLKALDRAIAMHEDRLGLKVAAE